MKDLDNNELIVENNKRKRSDSVDVDDPMELLKGKIAYDIITRLRSEISELQSYNKKFNVSMYIRNYKSLLNKEKKLINRKQACKDVITFQDFMMQ
mgnify:CR=1 FL=1